MPSNASRELGSFAPLGFQNADTVGVFFSHNYQDYDYISSNPYAIYDVTHPQVPINLGKLGIGSLDSYILEPDRSEFLDIQNTNNGFRIVKAHFGVVYSLEFDNLEMKFSSIVSFDTKPELSTFFNVSLTHQSVNIYQGYHVRHEIGVIGSFGGTHGTYFTMFFDDNLNLLKIDSFTEPSQYQGGYGLFKQNDSYVIYNGEMNDRMIYDNGWHQWENISSPIIDPFTCNSVCVPSILSIGNTIRVHEYVDSPIKFQVSNVQNLTAISEFTVPEQPSLAIAFLLHNETSFLTSVLNNGNLELWYHNMTDTSQKLLFSYHNETILPSSNAYYLGGSLTETASSYYVFWDQTAQSGVNEVFYAKIPKNLSSIEISQLSNTDQITDDYNNPSFFPIIGLLNLMWLLIPVFFVIYIITRKRHTQNLPVQDLTYPEKKDII